jgi:hypothetical protein
VPEHDRVVTGLRTDLGDGRFEALRARGARLTLDQVVSMVLDGHDGGLELVELLGPVQELVHEGVEKS